MTRYTIVWPRDAEEDLAEIRVTAPDRSSVTAASLAIDNELAQDAARKGLEVSEGLRALYKPPLRALFAVREDGRVVEVLRVKHA